MLPSTNKKILVVNDDPDFRHGIYTRLKASGYDTVFAAEGLSGLAEAEKHRPDLIILDLGLPAGDGFFVLARLKMNPALAAIPVLIVSARGAHANKVRSIRAGTQAFLEKPMDIAELLAVVRELLA
jgi:DNA-binding response OmpR family regulator